jgi:hypothetical protein
LPEVRLKKILMTMRRTTGNTRLKPKPENRLDTNPDILGLEDE